DRGGRRALARPHAVDGVAAARRQVEELDSVRDSEGSRIAPDGRKELLVTAAVAAAAWIATAPASGTDRAVLAGIATLRTARLRGLMPWMASQRLVDKSKN